MQATEVRVSVRVPPDLKARIAKIENGFGVMEADVVRRCLEAFCDYAERENAVRFPIRVSHDAGAPRTVAVEVGDGITEALKRAKTSSKR